MWFDDPPLLAREAGGGMTHPLRIGDWRTALAGVTCDALIADPPFGAHCHKGNTGLTRFVNPTSTYKTRADLSYAHWTPDDVREFVASWSPRCTGWMACMTSDDLIPVWQQAYAAAGRLDFAPVPCLQHRPRMGGDGPGSGAVYLMVARPREKRFLSWGSLPCWYMSGIDREGHIGGKPLSLMLAIVRDYSRPGDTVCDPCAGGGTPLLAALRTGRKAIGAEIDPATANKAVRRIDVELASPTLFEPALLERQEGLL